MKKPTKQSVTTLLHTNVNDFVHNLLRELTLTCRKVTIYGGDHPSAVSAFEKPFMLLNQVFEFKKYFTINLQNGHLSFLNIRLKESVFSEEIIKYMQVLDINNIVFDRSVTAGEFGKFLNRFVRRVKLSDHSNLISSYLNDNNIDSISVNSEFGYDIFEHNKQYRGDVSDDLSLRNIIFQQLPDSITDLAALCDFESDFAEKRFIDYNCDILEYLIPEKAAGYQRDRIEKQAMEHIETIRSIDDQSEIERLTKITKKIYELVEFHPDKLALSEKLDSFIACEQFDNQLVEQIKTPAAKIRYEASETIDDLFQKLFVYQQPDATSEAFDPAFNRLIKTNQREKATNTMLSLVGQLNHEHPQNRQLALEILLNIVSGANQFSEAYLIDELTRQCLKNIFDRKETFEYSDLVWLICEKALKEKNYTLLQQIVVGLNVRRTIQNNITVYDSLVVKKVFSRINEDRILNELVDDLLRENNPSAKAVKELLIAIGSEEVAKKLTAVISHPERTVRQQALRILSELGNASLTVVNTLLKDTKLFDRESNRRELPDHKWYVIRNGIFLLGLLQRSEGVISLRSHINDPDIRVRREIITSLEKIGGEEAVDLLMMMSNDADREIREAAVMTIGLLKLESSVPLLIDLIKTNPYIIVKAIQALGRIGTVEAKSFLAQTLTNEADQINYTGGAISKDDLKLSIIKALGQIGDDLSLDTIKKFQENLSTTQKILFKNSPVNKTIKEILSKN